MTIFNGWLLVLLGDATPSPSPSSNEPDASLVSPGWLGFVSLVFLSVTVFVIWKSMNRQFKKIDFDEASTERPRKSSAASSNMTSEAAIVAGETPAEPAEEPVTDNIFDDGSEPSS